MNEFERRLLDTVQNSTWIASVARPGGNILSIDYFNYNTKLTQIANGGNQSSVIQIQSDSDFAIAYMSGSAVDLVAGSVQNQPIATLQITDTGSGKTFYFAPTLFNLVMGTAGLPFYLPAPRVVAPNTNLQITINNIASTNPMDFYVNLLGARIYYAS